ncbi:MAG: hypothetical protein KJ579_05050, partial [Verrucomicrobia bacterium]|nr:hypothetical protein [Verrucomicrobiota bacterium]
MRTALLPAFLALGLSVMSRAATPDPSLLLWLPLDEAAGDIAADRSARALEADLDGTQWARGAFGVAARFGGTNAVIEIPTVPGLNGATQLTVAVWALWDGPAGRYPNLLTSRTWSPGGLMLFVRDNTCAFRLGRPGHKAGAPGSAWTETSVPLLTALPQRRWTHLCVVFDRPRITAYVDGRTVAHGTWAHPVEADGLRLGAWQGPVSHAGMLDDVRLYGRALTEAEVAALASDPTRGTAAYTIADAPAPALAAMFKNRHATLAVDTRGRIVSLRNRTSGRELLARPHPLVTVRLADGRQLTARTAVLDGHSLTFTFPGGVGTAVLDVDAQREFFTFAIRSLTVSNAESLTFLALPVVPARHVGAMANMLSDDTDAVCLRGYELPVEMSAGGGILSVRTTAALGLTGGRAGLAAGPRDAMPAMLRTMAAESGAPVSKLGGPWSLGAEANRGSYLFADLSHASTDDWIDLARRGGFTHIHLHGWWRTLGHYDVITNLFPRGLADMRDSVDRIHRAGLKAGIHTLTGCIDTRDAWVTPEASPHLAPFDTYTLARPLSPTDTVLQVREPPAPRHDVVFTYSGNGNAIRIGAEIVQYRAISREPPYAFTGCVRGAFKTRPAAHAAGERADYLQQRYMAFYPQPGSPLAAELADRIAGVFNACGLDQIYFDGSEGMMSRFGIDTMRHEIFRRLRGDVLVEASCHGAHNWWFHSRLGAWDHPVWAAKRFQDRHIAESSRYRASDLIEPQMGWWAPRGPDAIARGHFLDEMEYFAAKNLGLDSAMSIQGVNVSRAPLPAYVEDQFTLLGWYERLRLARYFDSQTVARVAVPGDEFRLRQNRDGEWRFTPVVMDTRRIGGRDDGSGNWTHRNPFASQPLAVRIEALFAVEPFDSPKRIPVADHADLSALACATALRDVSIAPSAETSDTRGGGPNLRLRATNETAARTGTWARAVLAFPAPYRNLSGAGAFGVWVKGDGKGALLNVQFATPREYMHAFSDHHVRLDFTGWRYVELLLRERDVEASTRHVWPYGGSYDLFRNSLDMAHVSGVAFYLNDLPPRDTTEVVLGPVVALP